MSGMQTVFEAIVDRGQDPDSLLSQEVLQETGAEVLTPAQAAARGFSPIQADAQGREVRLIVVPSRDAQFVQRRLEANHAVVAFRQRDR
jgi:hypothetical protein